MLMHRYYYYQLSPSFAQFDTGIRVASHVTALGALITITVRHSRPRPGHGTTESPTVTTSTAIETHPGVHHPISTYNSSGGRPRQLAQTTHRAGRLAHTPGGHADQSALATPSLVIRS